MNTALSRNERLWEILEEQAQQGKWSYQTTLYPSEITRIEKQWGVSVQRLRTEGNNISCLITWNDAFGEGINYYQAWYISKLIENIPQVKTPAQRLYLIAARA